jgi:hypothetical protein
MAGNEDTIPSQYVQAFEENIGLMPQQMDSRLVGLVDSNLNYTKKGDMFNADDLGKGAGPQPIQDRFGVSPEGTPARRRRVGFFEPYDDGEWLDDVDEAKSLSDLSNPTLQDMQAGHERYRDLCIIQAAGGAAREGRNGENSVALPASQLVAVNSWAYYDIALSTPPTGNAPLTLSKLIETGVKLDSAEIQNAGGKTFVTSAKQIGNLLRDKTITSADYNAVKALINGEINTFMGFTFVKTELLPLAAGIRTSYAFVKKAIMYRGRKLQDVNIVKRPDRKFNWYAYYKGLHGAVRRYDEGVVAVAATEA